MSHLRFIFLILLFFLVIVLYAENTELKGLFVEDRLELDLQKNTYQLSFYPLISFSESINADSLLLLPGKDYHIDYKQGKIYLKQIPSAQKLIVSYILIPTELRRPYYLYAKRAIDDSTGTARKKLSPLWIADDSKLNISGSKTFALTFADDEAFDLKQSLFVNLSGELSENINILAQLSDSQSKLSPEGDSKELSSLDQVFIKIFGKQYEIAMGDLEWEFSKTKYMNYKTKFEGINLWYKDQHAIQAAYSANNGKRSSQLINIIDGKQGPYYLSAGGYQQNFIVVAGSEQIYMDGKLLERGLDYSIEYAEGSVMFKTLVTSSNNVDAYFQYSDENYKQAMYLNSSRIAITDQLSFSHHIIHQTDNKNAPLQYVFSAADLDSLRLAGDKEVWGDGIAEVNAGSGNYRKLISGDGIEYYQYAAGDSTANYNIFFSYVGYGLGDYEEYSTGKYQYVGSANGSWTPMKRIIPPQKRTNINSRFDLETQRYSYGVEALYSNQDKNVFSGIDDDDNDGFLLYGFGKWRPDWDKLKANIGLELEKRSAHSFLFGTYTDPEQEIDFSTLPPADSLAQHQANANLKLEVASAWKPEISIRYKSIENLYEQKALRLGSRTRAFRFLPELNLQSTLSEQVYADSIWGKSLLQYHRAGVSWQKWLFTAKFDALYNSLVYTQEPHAEQALSIITPSTRYQKFNPSLSFARSKRSISTLSYTFDQNELKRIDWEKINSSDVYSLRHTSTFVNHNLDVNITHRELRNYATNNTQAAQSSYDLVNLRSNHNFFKQAIAILTNYQLNQTEFYPRIRELEYVGAAQGMYDSTGVYVGSGDYDYVYITSETGTMSTEINGQLNLYLKPAYLSQKPFWQRLMTDSGIQVTEQNSNREGYDHYFFLPGSVFNTQSTIYGKQSFQQNLWYELWKNKLNSLFQIEISRSLDQRYQVLSRTYAELRAIELEVKQLSVYNLRLRYENKFESDTRYNSEISYDLANLRIVRNLNTQTALQLDVEALEESGISAVNADTYQLRSISLKPSIRSVWMQKYRLSTTVTAKYNDRSGSDYLTFLPEKRSGFISLWSMQAIYRLNPYTTATLEYSGNSYPKDRAKHQLKIEIKAEL